MDRILRSGFLRLMWLGPIALAALVLGASLPAHAQLVLDENAKTVDGLLVYIGLVPAEMMKPRGPVHPESEMLKMHGGLPSSKHGYHFTVAIFDTKTGDRVTDARVTARFSPLGLVGPSKELEIMHMGDVKTYGQFFDLPTADRYVIKLEIKRNPGGKPVEVDFVEFTFHHTPGSHP